MQSAGGQWGLAVVDDGSRVRCTASEMVSAALGVQATATSVRSAWLPLHTAYQAPEGEILIGAMDDPWHRAVTQVARVRALRDVLWAYAEQLDRLASAWVKDADLSAFLAERDALDLACADAIAALHGPRIAPTPARVSQPAADGNRPPRWRVDPLGTILDDWFGLRPPKDNDAFDRALYGYDLLTFAGSTTTSWVLEVDYSATARPFPRDLKTSHAVQGWSTTGKVLDRIGLGLTFASATRSEWQRSESYAGDERMGRSLTVGVTTTAGAWAGAQAGAWAGGAVGTALFPGAGTAVGAALGGVVGGFAGSEVGGWVGDQVVDLGGQAGDLVGDGFDWAQDTVGDSLDTATFWD
ncbi:MAG: hypothetical protein WA880_12660 [Ornithinimicrobium sp.]